MTTDLCLQVAARKGNLTGNSFIQVCGSKRATFSLHLHLMEGPALRHLLVDLANLIVGFHLHDLIQNLSPPQSPVSKYHLLGLRAAYLNPKCHLQEADAHHRGKAGVPALSESLAILSEQHCQEK